MSLLLLADPGTRWTRTAETWVVGPSSYPLDLVERIILILELPDELWGRRILTENFLTPSPCRWSVSNCWWTLDCWAVVLSTRPRSVCWQNNFGTSWWVMRSRNLKRKYSKSKSLNLSCETKNIFNRQVSLDRTSVGLEPPIINLTV